MSELFFIMLFTALFCNGLSISTQPNMLLWPIRRALNKLFNTGAGEIEGGELHVKYYKIYYPILYCVRCMPSIYGTILTLFFLPFTPELTWQIPLIVFCSCALSTIFGEMYEV